MPVHQHAPDRQHPSLTLAVLALSALTFILLQSMVVPALPTIQLALHTSQSHVAWVLTAYLLSASIATPVLGRLGDMFGKKRILVCVLASLVVGAIVAATTSSLSVMLVARVLQGGGGAIFPLAFSIIRDEFPRARVAGAIGFLSAIIGVGAGVAIVAAGPIVDHLSFHWLFWIPGAMATIAMIATIGWVPESPIREPGRINVLAVTTLSGWLVALLLAVSEGANWGWTSARTLGAVAAGVALFVAWVVTELRSDQPLVDVRMMRIPTVWWTNVSATLMGFGMFSLMIAVPQFLLAPKSTGYGMGQSVTGAGFALLPMSVAMLVAGILTGPINARYGAKVPLAGGAFIAAAGMLALALFHGHVYDFYIVMAVTGVGIGLAFSAMSNLVVEAVPATQTGVATGMNANVRTIGGSIGSQVSSSVIVSGVAAGALPHEHGYLVAFVVMGSALAAAGAAALLVPNLARRRAADPSPADTAHEFDNLGADPLPVALADAGVALQERMH